LGFFGDLGFDDLGFRDSDFPHFPAPIVSIISIIPITPIISSKPAELPLRSLFRRQPPRAPTPAGLAIGALIAKTIIKRKAAASPPPPNLKLKLN
jgi:hypothetical protein